MDGMQAGHEWRLEDAAIQLAHGLWLVDLGFGGRRGIVAAYLVERGDGRFSLVETGPGSTLPRLLAGIAASGHDPAGLTDIVLTHIHLDHAGAAGLLARDNPGVTVHVHPFGAPHLVDPSKLVSSATRIYGDQMETLWGEMAPIAEAQVHPLEDGETLDLGSRSLQVLFTPGHAWHHIAAWDAGNGDLFTGDVGGIVLPGSTYACPPTPPPDFSPADWSASIARMRDLRPLRLLPTHFGPVTGDLDAHWDQLQANLDRTIAIAEGWKETGADRDALTALLHEAGAAGLGDPGLVDSLESANPSYMAAMGLDRYLAKRDAPRTG